MPRVADIYAIPVGTEGAPNTTIESAKYNSLAHDIEYDLNFARPIVAGGTGATNAAAARTALGAAASANPVFTGSITLTGNPILVSPTTGNARITLNKPTTADNCLLHAQNAGVVRWSMVLGDSTAETGGNLGSNFQLQSYADAGAFVGTPVTIARGTMAVSLASTVASAGASSGALTVAGGVGIGLTLNVAGVASIGGALTASANTQPIVLRGGPNQSLTAPSRTDTNIVLYDQGATNWAGIGVSANGDIQFVTGSGVTPVVRVMVDAAGVLRSGSNQSRGVLRMNSPAGIGPAHLWYQNDALQFTTFIDNTNGDMDIGDSDLTHGVKLAQNSNSWAAFSDMRLAQKQNARPVTGVLDRIENFQLVEYGEDYAEIGVLAQQLYQFAPRLVIRGDDTKHIIDRVSEPGVWCVKPSEAAWVALQVGKEIYQRLVALEQRLEEVP